MQKKVLTAAIAGALAAPMAAQAVDFSMSGHINRAVFILDSALNDAQGDDKKNSAEVADHGSSGTRIRARGSSELMEGNTAGVNLEYGAGSSLSLRHANVWFSGAFGKLTLGQGSEAGDGGVYNDKSGVFGVGTGQGNHSGRQLAKSGANNSYFDSLDGGGRVEAVRYDTPSLGPIGVAVSMANGDNFSAALRGKMSTDAVDFSGTIATHMAPDGNDTTNISFGTKFSNGFTWYGAWAQRDLGTSADKKAVAAASGVKADASGATSPYNAGDTLAATDRVVLAAVKAADAVTRTEKPTYWQTMLGYVFGNNSVAIGYYNGENHVEDGSESTAIGIGFMHKIPKAKVEIFASAQNYEVEKPAGKMFPTGNREEDETVITVGSRIMF